MNLPKGHCLQNGKYQLTDVIGQGGFGITYAGVWNTEVKGKLGAVKTNIPVCIKEYFFKDYCYRDSTNLSVQVHSETGKLLFDKFKEKQIKEAKILSEVHHPYIVNVLEVFEENNTAYIAMEYISGCSLKYMLDIEGKLQEKNVLKFVNQIGQALDFVHKKNILHLDIKPNNILIDKQNNARLIDFGVSKRYDIEQQETSTTMLTLSKGFASIEQYDSEGIINFSPCPDVYSLGATMYNLLTGVIPTESILRVTKSLIKPSELNEGITLKTESVILRAMQISPAKRYQTIKEMINELDIPSYFEETENLLEESFSNSNIPQKDLTANEATEVYAMSESKQLYDEEQTIVLTLSEAKRIKKKRKRRVLIPVLVFFFAFVGYAISYIFSINGSAGTKQDIDLMADIMHLSEKLEEDTSSSIQATEELSSIIGIETGKTVSSSNNTDHLDNETKNEKPQTNSMEERSGIEEANTVEPSTAQIDAEYNILVASGKTKMSESNFTEAKKDFAKAKDLKMEEEVFHLIRECEEKEEEKNIADRKVLYNEIKTLGKLVIAQHKATRLYGAIDSEGNEQIKAIYVSIGHYPDGVVFQRKDNLFDIYDINGEQVGKGLASY
jgi:serine/threonine-protein kinase